MNRKKICFVAQFPPPMHGLSKAVETLYYSQLNSDINSNAEFEFEKINLSNNRKLIHNLFSRIQRECSTTVFAGRQIVSPAHGRTRHKGRQDSSFLGQQSQKWGIIGRRSGKSKNSKTRSPQDEIFLYRRRAGLCQIRKRLFQGIMQGKIGT